MICLLGCGLGQFKPNNFGYDISWKVIKHIYIICPFQNYCQLFYIKLVTTTVNEVSTVTNVTPVTYVISINTLVSFTVHSGTIVNNVTKSYILIFESNIPILI